MTLFDLLAAVLIIVLFIYDKLSPQHTQLHSKYRKPYLTVKKYLNPILDKLNQLVKPLPVGQTTRLDLAPVILVMILLTIILL